MKCCACDKKAEMTLQLLRKKEKVGYCRAHWLALCMQETFKHLRINNVSIETVGKMLDEFDEYKIKDLKEFKFDDFFKVQ